MADLSITVSSVAKGTTANISPTGGASPAVNSTYNAAVTITAGQSVYLDASATPNVWRLSQCDGTAAESHCDGIALHGALAGQPLVVQTAGPINLGAVMADGQLYCVSAAAGGIAPVIDLVATNRLTIIGFSSSTSILQIRPWNTEKALAVDVT